MQRGKFSFRPRNDPKFYGGEYPFIQTGDIVKGSLTNEPIPYTQTLNELGLSVSKLFDFETIIITIAANIGDTAILDYSACFPDSLVSITPKTDEIGLKYLNIYLKFVKKYLENRAPQSAQKNLNLQQLSPTPIVIPPLSIQDEIVTIFENGYAAKREKEAKAEQILSSIDSYLLEQLGIVKPTAETELKSRIFYTNFCVASGSRLDPKKYLTFYDRLKSNIQNGRYSSVSLSSMVTNSVSGDWGKDENDKDMSENPKYQKCLVIRATEFDNVYNLKLDGNRAKFRMIFEKKLKRLDVQTGDLLIEKSGGSENQPVGRIAIIEAEMFPQYPLAYSNFVHKIRVDSSQIDSEYLFCFLKMVHNIKLTDVMQSQTNGIRNLIMSEYLSQSIPLPPIEVQQTIAQTIRAMRDKAKTLQQSAVNKLEQTKKEIESVIIGKSA